MGGKDRSASFSRFLVLVVIALGVFCVQGCQAIRPAVVAPHLAPPVLGSPSSEFTGDADNQNINISISILVTDYDRVATVRLHYRITGSNPWISEEMSPAGTLYKATIGPFQVWDNVSYYINATDASGSFACSPANAPTGYYTIMVVPHSGGPVPSPATALEVGGEVALVVIVAAVLLMLHNKKSRSEKLISEGWQRME